MTLNEQLAGNFPKTIDKNGREFKALVTNANKTGAMQKTIANLLSYMKEWCSTPNVYEQHGIMLKKTTKFFSFLEMFTDETEESFKNRFGAIFVRNHDSKWGTPYDIKSVFKQYFKNADIYLVENTNKIDDPDSAVANLFKNPEIDNVTIVDEHLKPDNWSAINCDASENARFSKAYGVEFNTSGGVLSQTLILPIKEDSDENPVNTTFCLHFFMKGKLDVEIVNNTTGMYWDFANKVWKVSSVSNRFERAEWDNVSLFFITADEDVTISFKYVDTETYADYFRLFQKQPYGSFTVIAHFEGYTATGVFGLAGGESDPNIETQSELPPQPRYSNYGYYDKSFLSGVPVGFAKDIYEDLLDYLRGVGIKAYLEIVIRNYKEPDAI